MSFPFVSVTPLVPVLPATGRFSVCTALAGAVLDDAGQGEGDVVGDVLADRALLLRLGLVDDLAVGVLDLLDDVVLHRGAVVGEGGVAAGHVERADLRRADRDVAGSRVPAGRLRGAGRPGHVEHLVLAVLHRGDEVDEGGVDRVRRRVEQADLVAVALAVLVADDRRVTGQVEGVAAEQRAQAVAVLEPGGQGVGLERRGGRSGRGRPVPRVLDVVRAAVEGEHLPGVDVDRGDAGVQLRGLLPRRVGGLLGDFLGGLDRRVLRRLVEGRGDLQPAAVDLLGGEAGVGELALDHLEQEALGPAVALVGLDLGELRQLLRVLVGLGLGDGAGVGHRLRGRSGSGRAAGAGCPRRSRVEEPTGC